MRSPLAQARDLLLQAQQHLAPHVQRWPHPPVFQAIDDVIVDLTALIEEEPSAYLPPTEKEPCHETETS